MTKLQRQARKAAEAVLHGKGHSKAVKMKRGSALTSTWDTQRRKPYTAIGIGRVACIRCGHKATQQWQICADKSLFRAICDKCDIALNRLVLKFMRHPEHKKVGDEYAKTFD
jgi:hypothetical protein